MEGNDVDGESQDQAASFAQMRPSVSLWLWRPWYAKLWWTAAAMYWFGKLASCWVNAAAEFYSTALAGFLNVLFFPLSVVVILSVGVVQACFASGAWELEELPREKMFPKRSMGGWIDPYSDPIDSRSGPRHWRRHRRQV